VKHKPSGSLHHIDIPRQFVGTDSVLAVVHQPHSGEPLVQTDGAVLENRSYLDRELLFAGFTSPQAARRHEGDACSFGGTARALRAIRPAHFRNVAQAGSGIGIAADCFGKSAGRFHVLTVQQKWY